MNAIASNCLSVRLRLMNRMVGTIYNDTLRPHDIKASQLNILVAVSLFGRATSQQLCRLLHMDSSTLSRAVARLKKKRWLQVRPSGEGKILEIEVAQAGIAKIEQVYPDWERAQAKVETVLGKSTSEVIIESGNKHLMSGVSP